MTTSENKALALFDLDHTLLPIDSDKSWVQWLADHGLAGDPEEIRRRNDELMDKYHAGTLDIREAAEFMLGVLTMHSPYDLAAYHERFMAEVVRPVITPEAIELVDSHQRAGHLCCLVSATNSFVIRPIGRAFGFKHIIGTTPEFLNGRFTGSVSGQPSYQGGKVIRVEQWLSELGEGDLASFAESYFYSDSMNDVPLLEKVTHPVATNPQGGLRELAESRGWKVTDLFELR